MGAPGKSRGGIIEGINVTPLVDITLVLLVIFMVTAKMSVAPAVPLDLPTSASAETVQAVLTLSVAANGALYLDGSACSDDALTERARAAMAQDPELRAVILADGGVPHRRVVAVMDALTAAGVERVAFGAQPEGGDTL